MTREQFTAQVKDSQKALRRFLVALCCGDSQLADDLAQETYIKAYLSCDSLNSAEKFRAWVFSIAHNTFLTHRRGLRVSDDIDRAADVSADKQADAGFRYQALYQALSGIPDAERTSILLYYMQGYAVKEIAAIEQTTPDAVRQHLSRGRRHLRTLLNHR